MYNCTNACTNMRSKLKTVLKRARWQVGASLCQRHAVVRTGSDALLNYNTKSAVPRADQFSMAPLNPSVFTPLSSGESTEADKGNMTPKRKPLVQQQPSHVPHSSLPHTVVMLVMHTKRTYPWDCQLGVGVEIVPESLHWITVQNHIPYL